MSDTFRCLDAIKVKLQHPFTCLCVGSTFSGKTTFLSRLLQYRDCMIEPPVERVIYSYKKWQPVFDTMSGVEFHQGMDFKLDKSIPTLLIIDDQLQDCAIEKELVELFTVKAHHDNTSVIFVSQNLFHQSKAFRTAGLNAMYLFLFKSPRGSSQVAHLARQLCSGAKARELVSAYEEATERPYSYFMIDMRSDTDPVLRYRTHILPDEGTCVDGHDVRLTTCYVI